MINLNVFSSIFIANWKLNGNLAFIKDYFEKLEYNSNNCTVICSPNIFLNKLNRDNKNLFSGAQDVSIFNEGAYTGELSSKMLKENNVSFCLVGHSERREYFEETNQNINKKINNLIESEIIPVICIGETLVQKEQGITNQILSTQIEQCIPVQSNYKNTIIAYEPIWAIGTGLTPSINDIQDVHAFIKSIDNKLNNFKVLYGGSVKSTNSKEIVNLKNVDGCLIGGASLNIGEFNTIIS